MLSVFNSAPLEAEQSVPGGGAGQIYVDSQGDQEKKKPSVEIKEARDCDTAAAVARPLPLKAVKCFR